MTIPSAKRPQTRSPDTSLMLEVYVIGSTEGGERPAFSLGPAASEAYGAVKRTMEPRYVASTVPLA